MFKKILIANRGEIALRVIRACRDLSISPVVVYSEPDRDALHVRLADEAYEVGPAPSVDSYLRIDRVLEIAKRCGAEAIHPGYGFLSENADFARAVETAGLIFIGPSPTAMELMGSKTSARCIVTEAAVPVVPGTTEPLASWEDACEVALRIGYPIMLKASAGGGGKGMRLVLAEDQLRSALDAARSESAAAFGSEEVYLEKAVARPRHIEIQIFADKRGNFVHLGERECSIQRRHQKVIEESPSPINDPSLRERMGTAAINAARAVDYVGAGTVEFLLEDATHTFYFLEMNTRLQVEHPVTELVTGIDLVREQIMVADGAPLSFTQADIKMSGHAIECRVYAEDPDNNFFPSPGRITHLSVPSGPGIRDDGGVSANTEVSIYYDPMISKLSVWGRNRTEAIDRMRRALDEYTVGGIKTTLPFFREIVRDAEFIEGRLDTGFIERFKERRVSATGRIDKTDATLSSDMALIAAVCDFVKKKEAPSRQPREAQSKWRMAGRVALVSSRNDEPGG